MGSFASTGDRQGFDWQRNKKIFCVFNLQEWPGQICREKTRIWCGSDRGLCGDFAFSKLFDNARNFLAQIAIIVELNCASAKFWLMSGSSLQIEIRQVNRRKHHLTDP